MPWGLWLVRIFRGEDVRAKGSGNIGATNVWRVYGRRLGLAAVLLDTLKGFVPALVATKLESHGHWRPLFLGFRKGGKMVATTGGAFLGVAPIVGGVGAGIWLLVFALTRYASLASMTSAASLPLWAWLIGYPWPVIVLAFVAAAGVAVLHRANIRRLVRGEENRAVLRRRRKHGPSASASL
jgi:glycerol-3-phosphate acyltransferase PlsY